MGCRDDFHHVAVLEFGTQRNLFVVDLGCTGAIADVAVDGIRKIDHRGARGRGHDLALGRKDIDRVREQIHLHVVPELGGIAGFVLDVEQGLQPFGAQPFCGRAVGLLRLVEPMGCRLNLCNQVHFFGAHLKFDIHPEGYHQCRVQ